ncbi:MAG: hypothetical protein SF123_14755, partial [Chloroflexota bacterium]|nr:hypothetical protein [Chloroflexota bacterium]
MRAAPYRLLFVLAASLTFLISWGALAQEPTLTPLPTETPTETATLLPPPLPPTESPLPSLTPTQPATSPAWSPDGSLLAYIRTVPGATPDALQRHLAYVTSDCREGVSCVDEQLAVSLSYQFSDLDWSATGDRLMAVQANMSAGGPGVTQDVLVEYTLGRSGTSLWVGSFSTVTQAPSIASPSYNATGTKAAYETTNNGVNEIRFVQRNIVNGGLDVVEGVAVTG